MSTSSNLYKFLSPSEATIGKAGIVYSNYNNGTFVDNSTLIIVIFEETATTIKSQGVEPERY